MKKVYISIYRKKFVLIDIETKNKFANELFSSAIEILQFCKDNKLILL